jgi:aminoglycoside phosphotransferase (APT) family kinase protein
MTRSPTPTMASITSETATRELWKIRDAQQVELARASDLYLREFLTKRLGLSNTQVVSSRSQGHVIAADSDLGRVLVKICAGYEAPAARRTAFLHRLLADSEIGLPDLLWTDLGREVVDERGLSCLVFRFVEGAPPRKGDAGMEELALRRLAAIHRIPGPQISGAAMPGITEDASGERLEVEAMGTETEAFLGGLGAPIDEVLRGPFRKLRSVDVQRVNEWFGAAVEKMDESALPRVLIHGDYHRGNLIAGRDGRIWTIDLDVAAVGTFRLELGRALLRILYGTTSRKLDKLSLGEFVANERLRAAEEFYLAEATDAARAFWSEHRAPVLVAAYGRSIRRLAMRSRATNLYPLVRRLVFRSQAFTRWQKLLDYTDQPVGS